METTYHLCRFKSHVVLHMENAGNSNTRSIVESHAVKDQLGLLSISTGIR